MNKTIEYQGKKINYHISGEGKVLLFIHGYLESSKIWLDFTGRFANKYKVILIDIPGHGDSEMLSHLQNMPLLADAVDSVLRAEQVKKVTIFGHSMGGYITLEYVSQFPDKIEGYCLFHSTCFADNEEKKLNRDREISLVKCGKKMQIVHTNIPKGFADSNIERFAEEISLAKEIAANTDDEGIIALLNAMKARNDHSVTLGNPQFEPLLICGRKDNYIAEEAFRKMTINAPHASVIELENSGHMGFIEEPDLAYEGIVNYLEANQTS
ncbi:alpha/beta fold hydrolase [Bacteroidota bacterium]